MHAITKSLLAAGLGCAFAAAGLAQQDDRPKLIEHPKDQAQDQAKDQAKEPVDKVSVPAGAQILVTLQHAITTKSAKVGDPVYAITSFPYAQNGQMLIPAGTYVQGRISAITRPGRVKGRAELLFHFTTLIYPDGYTVMLPGAVDNVPGMEHSTMKDDEGTIRQDGQKAHDVGKVAGAAATGGLIGAAAGGLKGAGIGGAGGAVVGTAIALFSRGNDLRLESGTAIQMVIQRPIDLDADRISSEPYHTSFRRTIPR
jgi:hypothetical protein